jgi:hypothetical protein
MGTNEKNKTSGIVYGEQVKRAQSPVVNVRSQVQGGATLVKGKEHHNRVESASQNSTKQTNKQTNKQNNENLPVAVSCCQVQCGATRRVLLVDVRTESDEIAEAVVCPKRGCNVEDGSLCPSEC